MSDELMEHFGDEEIPIRSPHRAEDEAEAVDHRLDLYHKKAEELPIDDDEDDDPHTNELIRALQEHLEVEVPLVKTHSNARAPERKTEGAAAADLYAVKDTVLKPGVATLVDLGIKIAIPDGYEMVICPRSGLSSKNVVTSIGTIDSDYRGEVKACLTYTPANLCQAITKAYKVLFEFAKNLQSANAFETARSRLMDHVKNDPFEPRIIKAGERVGQLKLYKVIPHHYVEVDELDDTERGDGGFGSTGR